MVVRLSSKGQLVIPRQIRDALGLKSGTQFDVRLEGDQIIFVPINTTSLVDELYGMFSDVDLLSELEDDHQQELEQDS